MTVLPNVYHSLTELSRFLNFKKKIFTLPTKPGSQLLILLWQHPNPRRYKFLYRHTLFYCVLLYCVSQILYFFTNRRLWQPYIEHLYQHHFSKSICSLHVSEPHFFNSQNISNFLIIIIFVTVTCDQWSLILLI